MNTLLSTHHETKKQIIGAKINIIGNFALIFISLIIGLLVNSIALLLDSSVGLVATLVATLMFFSIKKIHQPPDDNYNWGYEKYEPFTVAVQGGLIIASCVVSAKFAIQNLIHVEDITDYILPVTGTFISAGIGFIILLYLRSLSKHTNSTMLKSAAVQWYIDTVTSVVMFIGFLAGLYLKKTGYTQITPYIDPAMTLLLSFMLIRAPIQLAMANIYELLDASPGKTTRNKIQELVNNHYPQEFNLDRLRIRKAGNKIFLDICFTIKKNLQVAEIEKLSHNFEKTLKEHFNYSDVVVYFKTGDR